MCADSPFHVSPQNDSVLQQLAAIFTHCYGNSPIPSIPEIRKTLPARLGVGPSPLGLVPCTPLPFLPIAFASFSVPKGQGPSLSFSISPLCPLPRRPPQPSQKPQRWTPRHSLCLPTHRSSLSEQQGDVRCDLPGGREAVLRTQSPFGDSVQQVGSLESSAGPRDTAQVFQR